MPNVALRSFSAYGANDSVLTQAVAEIKDAVKAAKASGTVQVVSLMRKGYRLDLQVGDIYVIPPAVCDSPEDFPYALLVAKIQHHATPEGQIEFEMGALVDKQALTKDTLNAFRDVVFREGGEGDLKPLIIFRATWSSPHDALGFLYDEATVAGRLREVAYSAPFNPALSSVLDAARAVTEGVTYVVSGPVTQHMFNIPASEEQDYPEFVPGLNFAPAEEDGRTKKTASVQRKASIRLTAGNLPKIEREVLSDEELSVFGAIDDELGETVVASEAAGLRESPLSSLITAASEPEAPEVPNNDPAWTLAFNYVAQGNPVSWALSDETGSPVDDGEGASMTQAMRDGLHALTSAGKTRRLQLTLALPGTSAKAGIRLDRELGDTTPLGTQTAIDLSRVLFNRVPKDLKVAADQNGTEVIAPEAFMEDSGAAGEVSDKSTPLALFAGMLTAAPETALAGDLAEAIQTAYEWHGGMSSPLYSFASLGGVLDKESHRGMLENEIDECIGHVNASPESYDPDALDALQNLLAVAQTIPARVNDEEEDEITDELPHKYAKADDPIGDKIKVLDKTYGGQGSRGDGKGSYEPDMIERFADKVFNYFTKDKKAAAAPTEVVRAADRFQANFGGHYLPMAAYHEELSRLTADVDGAARYLSSQNAVVPFQNGIKVRPKAMTASVTGHKQAAGFRYITYGLTEGDMQRRGGTKGFRPIGMNDIVETNQPTVTPAAITNAMKSGWADYVAVATYKMDNTEAEVDFRELPKKTASTRPYQIRNAHGQKWACQDCGGVKMGGYWTDAEAEAHNFIDEDEAHEEVRRCCLGKDEAIVTPAGVGPLKLASWWSPGKLLARAYPELAGAPSHVPGKRSNHKKADSWWQPGQVAEQFAPGVQNVTPTFPGMVSQTEAPVINPFGAPGNEVAQAPVGLAGHPEGMNQMFDGVPLKTEMNFYGPEFMREFYAPVSDIAVGDLTVKHATAAPGPWVVIEEKTDKVVKETRNKGEATKVYNKLNAPYLEGKDGATQYGMRSKAYHEELTTPLPKKAKTAASHEDIADILAIASGQKKVYTLGGTTFTVYYDESVARGDAGQEVPGMVQGDYEVWVGQDPDQRNILRQHVSPGKPKGTPQAYAAERVATAILNYVRGHRAHLSPKTAAPQPLPTDAPNGSGSGDPTPTPHTPGLMDALNAAGTEPEAKTPYIDPTNNGVGVDNASPVYLMVDKIIKGAMGAYAAQLISAFNYTQKPLALETPFADKIDLKEVLAFGGASSPAAIQAAQQQLTHALELLTDDEKKQIVNDGFAQAAVWCESGTGSGGFTYEVFARVEAMEGPVLTLKVVTGIR